MKMHPVVMATIETHVARAQLAVAELEAKARTVPAGMRSGSHMLRLMKQINEAQAVLDTWVQVRLDANHAAQMQKAGPEK